MPMNDSLASHATMPDRPKRAGNRNTVEARHWPIPIERAVAGLKSKAAFQC